MNIYYYQEANKICNTIEELKECFGNKDMADNVLSEKIHNAKANVFAIYAFKLKCMEDLEDNTKKLVHSSRTYQTITKISFGKQETIN